MTEHSTQIRRAASCNCGKLQIVCEGEPVRTGICHCLECQRRTGSVFSSQAFFKRDQIASTTGDVTEYTRQAASGRSVTFRFCPTCGSTVYWEAEGFPGHVAVAVGSFADSSFGPPKYSVWERRRHEWVAPLSDMAIHHSAGTLEQLPRST